ncbi:MAG: sugar-binding protein [Actinomycetia bacterium]|nr:sugar-binding protein [Actinomycetes bacterium]
MKKLLSLALAAVLLATAFAMAGCGSSNNTASGNNGTDAAAKPKIGISMPTKSLQRWNQDGSNMEAAFKQAGYTVDLQYAGDNDVPTQVNQIQNMISGNCKVLVIAAIDGSSLTDVLKGAKDANITVIAYDRLIMNSDAVDYYATFDNTKVGTLQGAFIEEKLGLKTNKGPFNIELFTGDPADNNVNFFFGGAMDVLKPYIDSGVLKVPSGQVTQAQAATPDWSTENSQKRMENLISAQKYGPNGTKLDAVLSSNDSVANGITNALVAAGYTKDNFPILTGQDCDKTSVQNMLKGLQSMSVFKDTRKLADRVVKMVNDIVNGKTPEINAPDIYDNGQGKKIPTYQEDPQVVTKDDIQSVLIDSGYYKAADVGL